jgi:hypothetical protein
VAAVMIGADPYKGSHTAVVIGAAEEPLGRVRVRIYGRLLGAAGTAGLHGHPRDQRWSAIAAKKPLFRKPGEDKGQLDQQLNRSG